MLEALLAELRERLVGRHLAKPRSVAPHAVAFEIPGDKGRRLWLDASRTSAGLYLVGRADVSALEERDPAALPGRDRHALLLFRKHLDGRRLADLACVPGQRVVTLDFAGPLLALRLQGTPALTLALEGAATATIGEGAPVWPLRSDAGSVASVIAERMPSVWLPASLESCHDSDLAPAMAVRLSAGAGVGVETRTWIEATALFLVARRRGARFALAQKAALGDARRESRRLARLEANLEQDAAGLPEALTLRRHGEALLAAPQLVAPGAAFGDLPDPYAEGQTLHIALDPRVSPPANADRLFAKARRIDRARAQVQVRLIETRHELAAARAREARALAARDVVDLAARAERREQAAAGRGPRHYLTGRGLSVLIGRTARENHELTFALAKPEDLWLHARDVPGSHVILRDPEGRAGADDLREAAELAAFFSDARGEAKVDVHVTRRKHVRAARGGPGRVHVSHSETLRVAPRDPEGRLRRR